MLGEALFINCPFFRKCPCANPDHDVVKIPCLFPQTGFPGPPSRSAQDQPDSPTEPSPVSTIRTVQNEQSFRAEYSAAGEDQE